MIFLLAIFALDHGSAAEPAPREQLIQSFDQVYRPVFKSGSFSHIKIHPKQAPPYLRNFFNEYERAIAWVNAIHSKPLMRMRAQGREITTGDIRAVYQNETYRRILWELYCHYTRERGGPPLRKPSYPPEIPENDRNLILFSFWKPMTDRKLQVKLPPEPYMCMHSQVLPKEYTDVSYRSAVAILYQRSRTLFQENKNLVRLWAQVAYREAQKSNPYSENWRRIRNKIAGEMPPL